MPQLEFDNIFDLIADDPNDAADMKFRADLMLVMRDMFEQRDWNQSDVMRALDISQPRASELMRGRVDKFSSDK
uniref:helix-turn-helix domain-containing protein n=3 Tax=Pseudomonadota TaxID=1224 RepID=UPI003075CC82